MCNATCRQAAAKAPPCRRIGAQAGTNPPGLTARRHALLTAIQSGEVWHAKHSRHHSGHTAPAVATQVSRSGDWRRAAASRGRPWVRTEGTWPLCRRRGETRMQRSGERTERERCWPHSPAAARCRRVRASKRTTHERVTHSRLARLNNHGAYRYILTYNYILSQYRYTLVQSDADSRDSCWGQHGDLSISHVSAAEGNVRYSDTKLQAMSHVFWWC